LRHHALPDDRSGAPTKHKRQDLRERAAANGSLDSILYVGHIDLIASRLLPVHTYIQIRLAE